MIKAMQDLDKGLFNARFLDIWESNYNRFASFKAQQDKINLPSQTEMNKDLDQWASIQRRMKNLLPAPLKNKLAALDFDFTDSQPGWEHYLEQLTGFFQAHGHIILPAADPAYEPLREWLIKQIHDQQYLSEDQYQQLNSFGVDWNMIATREFRWQQMFLRLKGFNKVYGHSRVPQKWAQDPQLAHWVLVQRRVYARKKMPVDRERLLQDLNFVWHIQAQYNLQWGSYYQQLVAFQQEHGHCQVPGSFKHLASWIERQRISRKNKLLAPERETLLDLINFIWSFRDIKEDYWQEKYRQLKEYKQVHGHCLVPVHYKQNKSLGHWVASQRRLQDRLDKTKQQQLDQLGFIWGQEVLPLIKGNYDGQWHTRFEKLKSYQQAYGTCQVSLKVDPELQRWTRWQRKLFYEGRLSAWRRDQLDAIHFPWCIQEGYWLKMYEALADFKRRNGHTQVPQRKGTHNKLAAWVYRMKKSKAQLTASQVDLLTALGLDWHISVKSFVSWQQMFGRLVAFHQAVGHTRVPPGWPQDPKLGRWVSRMRQEKALLPPVQVVLLDGIAFDWNKGLIRKRLIV